MHVFTALLSMNAVGIWALDAIVQRPANLTAMDWPTPFSKLGCPHVRLGDDKWIWESTAGSQFPSCNLNARSDIGTVCVDADGNVDHSSIYVNMQASPQRTGCFAWKATGCSLDLRRVRKIEFDIDVTLCADVWAAPLWVSPTPWVGGGYSGEIDFAEACPVGDLRFNFAGGGTEKSIGSPWGLGGPKHIIMEIDDSGNVQAGGTLTTKICDLGGVNCHDSSFYTNFMSTVHATAGKAQSDPYVFLSDIWNGHGGDAGWSGCRAYNNPSSNCQYAIKSIKVHTNDDKPMFFGLCAVLNAADYVPIPPAPTPAPLPTESGFVRYTGLNCYPGHGGEIVSGDDPTMPFSHTSILSECEGACLLKGDCVAIMVPSNGSPQCFRRSYVNIAQCVPDQGYTLYVRGARGLANGTLIL